MTERPPDHWVTLARIVTKGDRDQAERLASILWMRHGVPGADAYIQNGQIVVSHPGGIPGLESGWERIVSL